MKQQIIDFLRDKYQGSYRFLKPKLFTDIFGYNNLKIIYKETSFLQEDEPLSKRVYCYVNNITELPKCKTCNKTTGYNSNTKFQKYCSNVCRLADIKSIQSTKKETNLKRYGATNVLASVYGKSKKTDTCLKRYGVDNYTKTQEYKDRVKSGNIARVYNKEKNTINSRNKYYNIICLKYENLQPLFTVDEYKGACSYKILYPWKCKECKTVFKHWLNNNYPVVCPKCKPKGTHFEKKIKQFLDKNNIQYTFRDRKSVPGFEIDFYLPLHNIGIEINGLYWHSEKNISDKNYHLNKTKAALQKNIRLIHVFEDELYQKPDIVFTRLQHILHLTKYKIYGRKCIVKEVDSKIKKRFIEKYHIQGDINTKHNYGLFYKNKLVAVMSFISPRKALGGKRKEGVYELARYCTLKSFTIVGGADKILKHFIKKLLPISILTYADLRWSQGNLYEKIGFKHIKNTTPNYWYTKDYITREHRFGYQKHLLPKKLKKFDRLLTEYENMQLNGYTKIWDCGHAKYLLEL